ncbi:MAG: hypothetical protein EPN69_16900 [Rhodanobacter sp.]|nr:MAG: hypothetical protein EPN69_16900 [Rhodanobacter sp.]TAL96916.1 MAG: hypothetical protein EPN71_09155 [Rhodanobacter sp.]TAM42673.1 MAG: hypothetical protein EPN58_02065 [Rhodanobacter sp.]TAN26812.1 MAG: hypothetical protein EPN32_06175 [Rhodanobacter sp.]
MTATASLLPATVPLVIGVTSHRDLAAHEIEPIRLRLRDFFAYLRLDFPDLPLVVLSALADGGDQLAAEEALHAGARLIAPLPLPQDLYLDDFSADARARFAALCQHAEILPLPLLPGNTPETVATHGEARNRQYAHAGVFIASHSHILLALWDGCPSDKFGGTAQIVRFHMDRILPGPIERRHSRHVTLDSGDESLLYHIVCSRADHAGTVHPPLQPLQVRWVDDTGAHAGEAGMPSEFRHMFRRMQQFDADAARYADHIDAANASARDDRVTRGGDCVAVGRLFAAADWLAVHFQRQVLLTMRSLYVLAALMGIAFVCYSDLPQEVPYVGDAIYLFVVLFAAGVLLAWLARRRDWHRKYIDYRALAEGLRVQGYWGCAGIEADELGAFAHEDFMQKQDIELGWIRNVMRVAGVNAVIAASATGVAKVIAEWIGEPDGSGQLGYYTRKSEQRSRVHRATQRLSHILLWAVIATSILLALFHRWLDADTTTSLVALMGVLAVIAAARESYAYRKADKELIKQYQYMRGIFASARRKLDATQDPDTRSDILRALGEAALAEHAEWALMHRHRPLEHGKM